MTKKQQRKVDQMLRNAYGDTVQKDSPNMQKDEKKVKQDYA